MFRLLRYLKPYWWQVILLLLSTGVQTWFTLELPALMAKIVNVGIAEGNMDAVWQIGLEMLSYAILTAFCAIISGFFASYIGTAFARDLRQDLYSKVLCFGITEINDFSTASLINRTTTDIVQVQQTIVMMLSMMLRAPMMCIVAVIQAFNTAPDMTWIIALSIGIMAVLVVIIIGSVMPKFKIFQKLFDKIILLTRENLTGLRVIRAFNNEDLEKKKFEEANSELTNTDIAIQKIMSLTSPLLMFIFNGVSLLCIWVGISLIPIDASYLGNMMAFMQYAIQVIMSFLILTFLFVMIPRANISAGRINAVLETKEKIHWKEETCGMPEKVPSIEFKNVNFRYEKAEENVLENISFKANAGETVAFIGSTGSGKSTLINLIPRFYEATNGEILINNLNIKEYSKTDLMSRIGFVPQRGILFSGTIKSNIKFGAPNLSDENLRKIAKISQAYDFIEKLPKKFDSHISQGGTNVSGGQKQRLSIARAIAKDPDFYVFDDSFSALDMKTDKKLRDALKPVTENSISLIVAQRASTVKDADQIIVLDKGKIVGKGNHYNLLKTCKIYQEIVKSQLSEAEYKKELEYAA